MKRIFFALMAIVVLCSSYECNKSKSGKLKGKLVIKELCAHYVVQVIDGSVDSSNVVNNWRDDKRQTSFDKVFSVANRCDFPSTLNEGDEFEFSFDPNPAPQNCAVCLAYYPIPGKTNAIKIQSRK